MNRNSFLKKGLLGGSLLAVSPALWAQDEPAVFDAEEIRNSTAVNWLPNGYNSLVTLNSDILEDLREIDEWDIKHKHDWAEYKRLKVLFGDA